MRKLAFLLLIAVPLADPAQDKKPPTTLRGVLLEQLRTTHNEEDWFVPASIAVADLTARRAAPHLLHERNTVARPPEWSFPNAYRGILVSPASEE